LIATWYQQEETRGHDIAVRSDVHIRAPMRRPLMGVRLMVEVLDHAPQTLTPRERWALIAIAEDARDETRLCLKGVESNPTLVRRMRAGRSERAAIIAGLIEKGALERVKRGQMHQHAVFRIPPLTNAQDPENPDAELPPSIRETRTLDDSQDPDSAVPGSGNCPPRVRVSRTPSPQSPQDPSSLSGAERVVMEALAPAGVTVDEMREVIKEIRQATKGKIENPTSYFRAIAQRGDLPDYLNRVRAAADRRAAFAARKAQPPPVVDEASGPGEPSVTPEEAAAARAAVREALRGTQVRKGEKGPIRVLRPQRAPEEQSPAVQAAHAYLKARGDFDSHMIAAREKLGPEAPRDEVVVLAADLARSAG